MHVVIEIVARSEDRPPIGAPIRAEVRDTSLEDVAAVTVASTTAQVRGEIGSWLETVELAFDSPADRCTIWVHVDVDGDGRVSVGDYITMQSYPLPSGDGARLAIEVRRV